MTEVQLKLNVSTSLYHCESCREKAKSVYDMLRDRWRSTRHASYVFSDVLSAIKSRGWLIACS